MIVRHPAPWFCAFALWFGVLWWLSSSVPDFPPPLRFTASDKLLHFGYFFGGAGLLSAAVHLSRPGMESRRRILVTTAVVALVGALDEYHQSFVPLRSGNDPFDFAADVLGAVAGSVAFQPFRGLLRSPSSDQRPPSPRADEVR